VTQAGIEPAIGEEAVMIGASNQDCCRLIARHVVSDHARDAVVKALYEAVVDGLEFGPSDLARADDRDWIRGHIAIPLQEATDAALEVLAWSVSRALERAPDDLLERYVKSHDLEDLGFE
jgi:hypothetical protein